MAFWEEKMRSLSALPVAQSDGTSPGFPFMDTILPHWNFVYLLILFVCFTLFLSQPIVALVCVKLGALANFSRLPPPRPVRPKTRYSRLLSSWPRLGRTGRLEALIHYGPYSDRSVMWQVRIQLKLFLQHSVFYYCKFCRKAAWWLSILLAMYFYYIHCVEPNSVRADEYGRVCY